MARPWSEPPSATTIAEADLAVCREMIRQGSKSFHTASLILPRAVREPAYAIYAFCRLSDDAVDGPDAERDAVAKLLRRLDLAYRGRPLETPVDRAFAAVVAAHGIPRELPAALLEGLAWDAEGRRYQTLADLQAYAARVAGAVGAMMTVLMGVREPRVLARACDLGVAMQLTNIARDIGEDARNGRIYLPLDWLAEIGLTPEAFLARPEATPKLARLVERLLAEADTLYDRALGGVSGLPAGCRPAINAARLIYREIGEEVRRAGHDSITRRAVVTRQRKVALLVQALAGSLAQCACSSEPALAETRFLVDAVPRIDPARPAPASGRLPTPGAVYGAIDERAGWVVDLFSRMAERDYEPYRGRIGSTAREG